MSEIEMIDEALDECGAPLESGGVRLGRAGRIRALAFRLTVSQNRQRGRAQRLAVGVNDLLEVFASRGLSQELPEVLERNEALLEAEKDWG